MVVSSIVRMPAVTQEVVVRGGQDHQLSEVFNIIEDFLVTSVLIT